MAKFDLVKIQVDDLYTLEAHYDLGFEPISVTVVPVQLFDETGLFATEYKEYVWLKRTN
jgi:hypothetical protein